MPLDSHHKRIHDQLLLPSGMVGKVAYTSGFQALIGLPSWQDANGGYSSPQSLRFLLLWVLALLWSLMGSECRVRNILQIYSRCCGGISRYENSKTPRSSLMSRQIGRVAKAWAILSFSMDVLVCISSELLQFPYSSS